MRALIQRVRNASVEIDSERVGEIDHGLLVLLGVSGEDDAETCKWVARKTAQLRIFEKDGRMQENVSDVQGQVLVVSQFTLYGNLRKGTRPSFTRAAAPELAEELYNQYISELQALGLPVATGRFGANMQVSFTNDGPVTLLLER